MLKQPRYLALALVPLFFGIHQISEGFVWLGLLNHDSQQQKSAALVYLFFALAFWPFWFPLFATVMEPQPRRKAILALVSVLATAWFWILYFPLLADPTLLSIKDEHHSIRYEYPSLAIYQYVSPVILRGFYFATLAIPLLVSSEPLGWVPGLLLALSTVIAALVFEYACVSVWSFFASVIASYCCLVFYRLPWPMSVRPQTSVS